MNLKICYGMTSLLGGSAKDRGGRLPTKYTKETKMAALLFASFVYFVGRISAAHFMPCGFGMTVRISR